MSDFWVGFEKRAKKSKKEELASSRAGHAMTGLAAPLAGIAAVPLALGGVSLDKKLSPQELDMFVKKVKKIDHLKTKVNTAMPHDILSGYAPGNDTAYVKSKSPKRGIVGHELGHAASMGKIFKKHPKAFKAYMGLYNSGRYAPSLAAAGAIASNDDTALKAAPYLAWAGSAPMILEEAHASGRALKNIAKIHGAKASLRSLPGLAGALATYMAPAAAAHYTINHYAKKKKELLKKKL